MDAQTDPTPAAQWTPAERKVMAEIEARQKARDAWHLQRAVQEQQQRLQRNGDIQ